MMNKLVSFLVSLRCLAFRTTRERAEKLRGTRETSSARSLVAGALGLVFQHAHDASTWQGPGKN